MQREREGKGWKGKGMYKSGDDWEEGIRDWK